MTDTTRHSMAPGRLVRAACVATALLAGAPDAGAQRTARTVGNDLWRAGTDIWAVWTSPLRADAGDWGAAAAVVGSGAAVSLVDDDVDRLIVEHAESGFLRALRPLRENRGTNLGDLPTGRLILPISGALYLVGFAADQQGLRDAATGCLASQQANSAVRHATYALVARTRPSELVTDGVPVGARQGDQYELDVPGEEWERRSFFGGHVANAFACVAFFNERFELGAAEPVLYAFAAGIAVARTVDRRHWVSDNLLGAAFGWAVGRQVAGRQKARVVRRGRGEAALEASPDETRTGRLLIDAGPSRTRVGWEVRF